ncbi:unnamed protein product, partial [Ixodes pacificus]
FIFRKSNRSTKRHVQRIQGPSGEFCWVSKRRVGVRTKTATAARKITRVPRGTSKTKYRYLRSLCGENRRRRERAATSRSAEL